MCDKSLFEPQNLFGHPHHAFYQIARTLALTGRRETAFGWLERSVRPASLAGLSS
jgi:hypothetical protein